ncbi:flavin reductase family protein, partial [Rhizobium leguminosarum]
VLDCKLETAFHYHSHSILVGHICAIEIRQDIGPLLYWRGGYRELPASSVCPAPISEKARSVTSELHLPMRM